MLFNVNIFFFVSILIFFVAVFGILFNRRSILLVLLSVEVLLLAVNINFIYCSVFFDDLFGQVFSLYVLAIAAAESAIGLALIVTYHRVNCVFSIGTINLLQGLSSVV